MPKISKDDLLEALGLETRKTAVDYVLPVLGIFGAGLAVGASLGILFAPKPGRELRQDIGNRMSRSRRRAREAMREAEVEVPTQPH